MTLLHDDVVDGVRTVWVDSGRPTLTAVLLFRAGMADETLATSGWLHLLEHLALHGRDRGSLNVNGSVSPLLTTFMFHGPPEKVTDALRDLSAWLAAPEFDELDRERRVLAAEEATRAGGGPAGRAFGMRYGARGPGLLTSGTPGLGRADAEGLGELASRVFVDGNAALALDGPPPAGLKLALAPGPRLSVTPALPVEHPRAAYVEPAGLVVSGVVPRSATNTLVAPVVEEALRRQLRDRDGAAYAPYSLYEGVDSDHALVVAGSDVSPATGPTLLRSTLDILEGLAYRGPDPAALGDLLGKMRQAYTDPHNLGGLAFRGAALTLQDLQPQQLEELLSEHDAVTPESLVPGLAALRQSLLVGAPPETAPHPSLRLVEQPRINARASGARSTNWPADTARLAVEEHALVVGAGDAVQRYDFADTAGYLVWPNGTRRIVLDDGWGFTVLPGAWVRGQRLVGRLDGLVPPELHLPQPSDTAPDDAVPAGAVQRWWVAAQDVKAVIYALVLVLVGVAGMAVLVTRTDMPVSRIVVPGLWTLVAVLWVASRDRSGD